MQKFSSSIFCIEKENAEKPQRESATIFLQFIQKYRFITGGRHLVQRIPRQVECRSCRFYVAIAAVFYVMGIAKTLGLLPNGNAK